VHRRPSLTPLPDFARSELVTWPTRRPTVIGGTMRSSSLKKLLGRRGIARAIRFSDHGQGPGEAFYAHACRLGLEGIVSKLASSPYRSERTNEWL
jgi:hypothetical protein